MTVADRVERPKMIALKVKGHFEEGRAADDDIYPGYLLVSSAPAEGSQPLVPPTVDKHASQGLLSRVIVACEDALQGKTINDAYAEGDIVPFIEGVSGDVLLVRVAPQAVIVDGTKLCSAGNGRFEALGGGDIALVEAAESVDYSAEGAAEEQFIRVKVL